MSRRRKTVLRTVVEMLVGGVVAFALAALVIVWLSGDDDTTEADVPDDAIGVVDLAAVSQREGIAVTGFLFVGERRAVLCSARTDEDPPFCEGSAIDLVGFDRSRLALEEPEDAPAYSPEEVTFLGDYAAGTLTIREVLAS